MTSISSLLGRMPSLVDYMGGGNGAGGIMAPQTSAPSLANTLNQQNGSGGDIVSLSPQAQYLMSLAQNGGTNATASGPSGEAAQKGAITFIAKFFADSGIDTTKLSAESKALLDGLGDLVAGMTNVSQDSTLDSMTKNYVKGQRESYTLQGDGQRISATVQYQDGKPKTLTVTQTNGTTANTATISLGTDSQGKLSSLNIDRVQKNYNSFGGFVGSTEADPLTLALYA